jgi:hypothetical protein
MANHELGPNTADTVFHLASVSKSFTAAAILILEQQGKMNVTDPLQGSPNFPTGQDHHHHLLIHRRASLT